jgi:hypothetical protein
MVVHFRRFRVRAACFAAIERLRRVLAEAALRACLERARREPAACRSRFNADSVARDLLRDGLCGLRAARVSNFAFRRVRAETLPRPGAAIFTPARRALDKPMAIACLADRAPCLPRRTCSISSRTYSPACVVPALRCRLSLSALRNVSCLGIGNVLREILKRGELRCHRKQQCSVDPHYLAIIVRVRFLLSPSLRRHLLPVSLSDLYYLPG